MNIPLREMGVRGVSIVKPRSPEVLPRYVSCELIGYLIHKAIAL